MYSLSRGCRLWSLLLAFMPGMVMAQTGNGHQFEVGKNLDIFNMVFRKLDLFYVDTLDASAATTAAIDGMLRNLDPYTQYYPESDTKDLKMMITGKYAGIGALIKYHLVRKCAVIDEPYENMPAAEAGVKKGDVILAIDDSLMKGKPVGDVSSRLRGDAGTTFVLRVLRPSTGKEMNFKITRRNIKLPELPYYGMRGDSIGYINLNQFTEGCAKDVRRAFIDLKERGARSLVLDLRGNGGGSEMEAVDIVGLWVPKGSTVVENRGKVEQANRRYDTRYEPVDTVMPIVVLVNDETASASEITSGSLQDMDRAVVLGTRTFGKGLVQVPMDLPYNTNLKVTISKYYIPSGRCIQAINYKQGQGYKERVPDSLTHVFRTRGGREVRDGGGIKPDIEVKGDTLPNIAYYLSVSGLDSTEVMFDYVVDYIARHQTIAPATEFHLTEDEWKEFCQRVVKSGFKYDPLSKKQLEQLAKTAKFEGYYDEAREAFKQLEEKLEHHVEAELEKHRTVIQPLIESSIISAYYYQEGAIAAGLNYDNQLKEAERILTDRDAYQKILKP